MSPPSILSPAMRRSGFPILFFIAWLLRGVSEVGSLVAVRIARCVRGRSSLAGLAPASLDAPHGGHGYADGFDDIYITVRIGKNMLLKNKGNGTFAEEASSWGLDL